MHESIEPVTGESTGCPPAAWNSPASDRMSAGVLVVRSIHVRPVQSPANSPFGPRITCSICAGPNTSDITT